MKMIRTEHFAERISKCVDRLSWQLGLVVLLSTVFVGLVYAEDGNFTNDTMETRVTSPPPNIMFVLDNSGSMDWSFMAPESSGKFNGDSYLWDINDNAYSGDIVKQTEWQARWSGYNRLFYTPHSSYVPWPRWNQSPNTDGRQIAQENPKKIKDNGPYPSFYADLKRPRSNPVEWEYTLNLHNTLFAIKSGNGTAQIKNAHYYMVDDKNGDGKPQHGEVYLVNFEWTDSDNDGKVEEDELSRRYFLVSYDNDSGNHEDVTSLAEVQYDPNAEYDANGDGIADEADAVPDSIQPITYDETLKKDVFVSDREDLQNFANWFSFYRRRELTAKAAVSRTIADLDNVYVGYNTMHRVFSESSSSGGGAKQPVLPIDVYESIMSGNAEITVDNKDAGFSNSGKFSYVSQVGWVTKTVT